MELLGITVIIWVVGVVAAVMLFLMPFFVFRIRNEIIKLNRQVGSLVLITRKINTDALPPPFNCPNCKHPNPYGRQICNHCKMNLVWE